MGKGCKGLNFKDDKHVVVCQCLSVCIGGSEVVLGETKSKNDVISVAPKVNT